MLDFLYDLMHVGLQTFGELVMLYWTIRLAIRHETERKTKA